MMHSLIFIGVFLIPPPLMMAATPDIWLDASDASTIQLSAGKVQQWNDKSGNAYHAIAPGSTNRPVHDGTKNSIEFDGVNDALKITGGSTYGPGNAVTFFVVAQLDDFGRQQSILTDVSANTFSKRFALHYQPWSFSGFLPLIDNTGLTHDNKNTDLHLISVRYDGATFSTSIDGSNPSLSAAAAPGDSGSSDIMLGSFLNLAGNALDGRIHEIKIYRKALSSLEVLTTEKDLSDKWGLALDETHPFSSDDFGVLAGSRFTVVENSPNGTVVGTPSAISSNPGFTPQDWRISPTGGLDRTVDIGAFGIDPVSGEIHVADGSKLDYEKFTTHRIAVSVSNGSIRSGGIEVDIDVTNVADGDPAKTHSQLWGANGELWNSYSRLPDWSHAGYHWGEDPIPNHAAWPVYNITSYGAVANDGNDDSAALQAAINAAPTSGAIIYMPAGQFVLNNIVTIGRSNLVLRGAGRDPGGTVLYCPVPMANLGLDVLNDHMVRFRGNNGNLGIINSNGIAAGAKRGDRTLMLDSVPVWQPGETVLLRMTDDGTGVQGSLWLHLHNDQADLNPAPESYASGTGDWPYTVERVSGKLITFREPLRTDVRLEWLPQLRKRKGISEVGAEDFKMKFPDTAVPAHFSELGYNGLEFKYVSHGWMRRLEFENGDNPVAFNRCHNSTMNDFRMTGRPSHHGPTADYEGNNLIRNMVFDQSGPFLHSITFTHKATGNVCSDISGNQTINVDLHGNGPMENLFTRITTNWGEGSSGKAGSQPHAAHGTTFWNNTGTLIEDLDDNYKHLGTTTVGPNAGTDSHTVTREWNEHIANVSVANIYDAQLARRLNPPSNPLFALGAFGVRSNWFERDPARWRIATTPEPAYEILFGEAPPTPGNRLSTYSIFADAPQTQIEMQVQTLEDLFWQPAADVALVLGWQDDENYLYTTVSATNGAQIVRVQNGNGTILASDPAILLTSNNWEAVSFIRTGNTVELVYNGANLQAADTIFTSGYAGIGSNLGKAAFKGVALNSAPPVAHWKLNEGTGMLAIDSSGNGYDGSILGANWGSDATRSSYLSFDGSNDRVETLFQVDLTSIEKDLTWAAWVNNQAAPSNGVIIGNRKPDLNGQLNFFKLTSKQVEFAGGGSQQNYDYADMAQGEWHHHAVVKSGSTLHYYRDGIFVDSRGITTFADGLYPFYMAGDPASGASEHFQGFIDDVVLYDHALAPAEIADVRDGNYARGLDDWRLLHFGTTDNIGTAADNYDANFDGESNLLEFATGQDPYAGTLHSTPVELAGGAIEFRYTRSKAAMADGMRFTALWSDSLKDGSWSNAGITESVDIEDLEVQHVVAIVPAGLANARFVRLRITP